MRYRVTRLAVILFAMLTTQPAEAQHPCQFEGEIVAGGQVLAGVKVRFRSVVQIRDLGISDSEGRFSGKVPRLQRNRVLLVFFEKPGFLKVTQSLAADPDTRCPVVNRRPIAMESNARETGSSTLGRTVFIAPYTLYGDVADADRKRLNRIFDQVIGHRIQAYRTSLSMTPLPPELSVRKLEEPLSMVDRERIRSVGSQRRALGVVTGEGELREREGGEVVFDLISDFSVIPRHERYDERRLQVGDILPRRRTMPSRLSQHLQEFWGQKAMIALAVHELNASPAPVPKDKLLSIRSLLVAVRSTMGMDDPLLEEVQHLLRYVEEVQGR